MPSLSVLNVRVTPFYRLLKVTFAFAMRAPEESETVPENEADEASVWPCARGAVRLIAKATTVTKRYRERLRNLGID